MVSEHFNRWLTDNIQNYIKNIDDIIKFLFEPFQSFSEMDKLFGLGNNYIYDQRMEQNSRKIIAVEILDRMRLALKINIEKWIKTYPYYTDPLLNAQRDIIAFIDEYENKLNPKPTSRYQIYIHHPNFIRDYFKVIDTKEKAYWLGFLFADGWIMIQHLKSGDYYRIGIELSERDIQLLHDFCKAVGLNKRYIRHRMRECDFTGKKYPMVEIKWQNQEFGNYLIELGMEYKFDEEKGHRVKVMRVPNLNNYGLMLSFLLGFFDGDGARQLKKSRTSVYPTLISSNKEFLEGIKEYFEIENDIYTKSDFRYNRKTGKVGFFEGYSLPLGIKLYREMLENYKNSLKRKRVPLEFFEDYGLTKQQKWVKSLIKKEDLEKMLFFLSPNYIANIMGVSITAIKWLAQKVFGIKIRKNGREYYNNINQSINYHGKNSPYYEEWLYWNDFLDKLEKF